MQITADFVKLGTLAGNMCFQHLVLYLHTKLGVASHKIGSGLTQIREWPHTKLGAASLLFSFFPFALFLITRHERPAYPDGNSRDL